jgi:NitT/TauT family transport system substrate-binding protein
VAWSLGFFRDEGLDVSLQDLASTPKALQALLGGSTDLVAGAYDGAVQMNIEGKLIQAIAVLERWPPFAVVVAPQSARSLRTISDLKGRVVGVASPGSSTHRFLNYLLARNGLSPSDTTVVGVGVNFSMAAAIQHGQVDAAVAGPLGMALLSKQSSPAILADCRTEKGAQATLGTSNLPSSALMVRAEWARSHTDIVHRIGNATLRSLAWIQAHSPEDISNAMPQEYKAEDAALYLAAVRDIRPTFSPDGVMPPDGPANVHRFLGVSDDRARSANIDISTTYTNEFISR